MTGQKQDDDNELVTLNYYRLMFDLDVLKKPNDYKRNGGCRTSPPRVPG